MWSETHIQGSLTVHGVSLLTILGGGRDQLAGMAVGGRGHHPGLTLHHRAEHMLGLGGGEHIACACVWVCPIHKTLLMIERHTCQSFVILLWTVERRESSCYFGRLLPVTGSGASAASVAGW